MSFLLYMASTSRACERLKGRIPRNVPIVWLNTPEERKRVNDGPYYKINDVPSLVLMQGRGGGVEIWSDPLKIEEIFRQMNRQTSGNYYTPEIEEPEEVQVEEPQPKKYYEPEFDGMPSKRPPRQPRYEEEPEEEPVEEPTRPPPKKRAAKKKAQTPKRKVYEPEFDGPKPRKRQEDLVFEDETVVQKAPRRRAKRGGDVKSLAASLRENSGLEAE